MNWDKLFVRGQRFRIKCDGKFKTWLPGQTVIIKGTTRGEVTDPDGDWPQALNIEGISDMSGEMRAMHYDNEDLRKAIERGDVEAVGSPLNLKD
ncbi:hypothetical protein ACFPYI_20320 [Halomarina salina]|uniref:Uncharacterized protein n=1 Tax=Halomarina salina TaxID=1872699 RepID=A0ABD5RTA7_9EURY